ncbi:hypothetical protein E4S40_10870 [Algoriphagus kandeliae]|uniref:DUF4177 domain-containing protein n=1 Tax=Algoriphagus kandeliae TaxID=2562278 RepID=A0A4Y9QPF6_9BACT|nr:hypothetical protein [Algoriphagus kandeliae]TFV94514.1 hypothetical protein E4S40_10870 [Algoriphagus kandeliae]
MKKSIFLALSLLGLFAFTAQAQESSQSPSSGEFKVITVVESIVPMGIGRSRIIDSQTEVDASIFTTERTDGKKSNQKEISRSDIKVDELEETKLLNFFSATGINFQNIASNDAVIASKINSMLAQGWELKYVTSGVESDGGAEDGQGIFITRLFFYRK